MASIRSRISALYSLEQLAEGTSCVHARAPLAKVLATLGYLICVVSFERGALARLVPYLFYPVVVLALAGIPYGMLLRRTLVALPFCLFAGIANLVFDRTVAVRFGAVVVTGGAISFAALLFRTLLCVAAVLILVAVTPVDGLTRALRRLHVPRIFVMLFEMTYRYLGTLLEEAGTMYTAYRLRAGKGKGIAMADAGRFIGQLFLRSADRAERVYHAMQCRGYPVEDDGRAALGWHGADTAFVLLVCGSSVLFRAVDVPQFVAAWLGRLF